MIPCCTDGSSKVTYWQFYYFHFFVCFVKETEDYLSKITQQVESSVRLKLSLLKSLYFSRNKKASINKNKEALHGSRSYSILWSYRNQSQEGF